MTAPPFLDVLEELITRVVDPAARIGRALRGLPLFG